MPPLRGMHEGGAQRVGWGMTKRGIFAGAKTGCPCRRGDPPWSLCDWPGGPPSRPPCRRSRRGVGRRCGGTLRRCAWSNPPARQPTPLRRLGLSPGEGPAAARPGLHTPSPRSVSRTRNGVAVARRAATRLLALLNSVGLPRRGWLGPGSRAVFGSSSFSVTGAAGRFIPLKRP